MIGSFSEISYLEFARSLKLGNKQGYRLSFGEHFRFGLPLTLVIAYFWIY
ncbi:hypothetical protein [Floridanema evergladense]|uniref:Uncharacterized protein n=1 Tax=Floridaenema evergladense BLCC-F167 TaxID=3153639 RepID=A0ABV4WTY8_9CYAN